jgi:hypothetical protein
MTAEMGCEQVRELAAELALDIAAGEERDAALRHLADCAECRRFVSELSSVGEELLLLAPTQEPPLGFESRVLDALTETPAHPGQRAVPARRRWVTAVAVAAAVALAAVLGGGSAFLATAEDRRLAEGYRAVLSEGQGSFFASAPLEGSEGRVGTVFGYEGRPSWIMVTLQSAVDEEQVVRVRALIRDGRYLDLGDAVLGGDNEVWGRQIPVHLSALEELRFVGPEGQTTFAATFGSANPW